MKIRLAIVNDYEVVVRGLAHMLDQYSMIEIVEINAQEDVASRVDIALYDTFAQTQGNDVDVKTLIDNPMVDKVVVYTWNIDQKLIDGTMAGGAAGYLSKSLSAEELVDALAAVHTGQQVISPDPGEAPLVRGNWAGRPEGLTAREAEIVALITQGLSNSEIAARASLSINSVKTYIRTAYRKMNVTSRSQAVLWGLEHGFAPDRGRYQHVS